MARPRMQFSLFPKKDDMLLTTPAINSENGFFDYVLVKRIPIDCTKEKLQQNISCFRDPRIIWLKVGEDQHNPFLNYAVIACQQPCDAEEFVEKLHNSFINGYPMKVYVLGKILRRIRHLEIYCLAYSLTQSHEAVTFKSMESSEVFSHVVEKFKCMGEIMFIRYFEVQDDKFDVEIFYPNFYQTYAAEVLLDGVLYNGRRMSVKAKRNKRNESLIALAMSPS